MHHFEPMALLEADGLGKRYGRRGWALRHVDVAIPDGSITALVGPNGSGKSTLLKTWIGFERPTEVDALIGDASKARDVLGWTSRTDAKALAHLMVDADLAALRNR